MPVAMAIGVLLYYIFDFAIENTEARLLLYDGISHYLQPMLIFSMLFLSFLKVNPRDLMPHRWHGILLLTQGSLFVVCSLLAMAFRDNLTLLLIFEGAMLCFICPTATASAVIVRKLGGSLSGDVTYLILCNLMVSLLAPGFLTLVAPHHSIGFAASFFMIMGKVFPLLLCPLFVALFVRHYTPRLMERLLSIPDLAFYFWLVALALAITVTVRTIAESSIDSFILLALALVSAIACVTQFALGRYIGRRWPQVSHDVALSDDDPCGVKASEITAGQAFGQKNTVFVIWMGLVFLNPVTSVVGGFYSIWHNVINSWQLYKHKG